MGRFEPPFSGIWPAMLTPFDADDRLNLPAAGRLLTRLIEEGAGGLYICGSSGEAPLLRIEERKKMAEYVIGEVAGRIPVIVHVGQTSPVAAVELAAHARQCRADGLSSVLPPFYNYTVSQIVRYWTELSRVSDLPFYGYVLHDVAASRDQLNHWLEALRTIPTFAGLKFTHFNTFQLALLKQHGLGWLNIFSGADEAYLPFKAQGADGAIGTTYNIALPLWLRVCRQYEQGNAAEATRLMLRCAEIVSLLLNGFFHHNVKRVLRSQGIDCGPPRPPLRADIEPSQEKIDAVVELIARTD